MASDDKLCLQAKAEAHVCLLVCQLENKVILLITTRRPRERKINGTEFSSVQGGVFFIFLFLFFFFSHALGKEAYN